jgi:hypothetical protein
MSAAEDRRERRRASWRDCRARVRNGKLLLRIVVDGVEHEELLRASGLLPEIEPKRADIERATEELLRLSHAACCTGD